MRKLIMCLSISLLVATGCSSVGVRGNRIPAAASGIHSWFIIRQWRGSIFMAIVPGFKAGTQSNEKVLMVKTLDPQNNRFREVACINDGKQPAYISPVYMQVAGNKNFRNIRYIRFLSPQKLSGNGTLTEILGLELSYIFNVLSGLPSASM